jgi:hypothetical protein
MSDAEGQMRVDWSLVAILAAYAAMSLVAVTWAWGSNEPCMCMSNFLEDAAARLKEYPGPHRINSAADYRDAIIIGGIIGLSPLVYFLWSIPRLRFDADIGSLLAWILYAVLGLATMVGLGFGVTLYAQAVLSECKLLPGATPVSMVARFFLANAVDAATYGGYSAVIAPTPELPYSRALWGFSVFIFFFKVTVGALVSAIAASLFVVAIKLTRMLVR